MMFIHSVVLWHIHSLFQSEFSTDRDLVLPLSIFIILLFPEGYSVSPSLSSCHFYLSLYITFSNMF